MILQHDRDRDGAGDLLVQLEHAVFVRHRFFSRRHHHRVGSEILRHARKVDGCPRSRRTGTDDDRHPFGDDRYRALNQGFPFGVVQPIGFAEDAEDGDPVDAEADHELQQPPPRLEVEAFVFLKRRCQDRNDACEHGKAPL